LQSLNIVKISIEVTSSGQRKADLHCCATELSSEFCRGQMGRRARVHLRRDRV